MLRRFTDESIERNLSVRLITLGYVCQHVRFSVVTPCVAVCGVTLWSSADQLVNVNAMSGVFDAANVPTM